MSEFSFNLDEQIFLRNEETNKTYTITVNKHENAYDVTREWSVPKQDILAAKTDRFSRFTDAAKLARQLYDERIANGYTEIMRRHGVAKRGQKVEKHGAKASTEVPPPTPDTAVTGPKPGSIVENMIRKRHITTLDERIAFSKK